MTKSYTHVGSFYSRNPQNGYKQITGGIYHFLSNEILTLDDLEEKHQRTISKALKKLERQEKWVGEVLAYYHEPSDELHLATKRPAKLHSRAYAICVSQMVKEKLMSQKEALEKIPFPIIREWYAPRVEVKPGVQTLALGDIISYGAGAGLLLTSKREVEQAILDNHPVLWLVEEVDPQDWELFSKVQGLIFAKSGPTSHAAVIVKGLGIPAISGCQELVGSKHINTMVTLDANHGIIYQGNLDISNRIDIKDVEDLLAIAQKKSKVKVYCNADSAREASTGNTMAARGVGLCRSEHMFLSEERKNLIRRILLDPNLHADVVNTLISQQTDDFYELFKTQHKKSVIIRLLDAPLHEFLPQTKEEIDRTAQTLGFSKKAFEIQLHQWKEKNPMLGLRGIRMLLLKPEILRAQIEAIAHAYIKLYENGYRTTLGIQLPLVISPLEVKLAKTIIDETLNKMTSDKKIFYDFGVMIETPRAALEIDEIATEVDFISFGTNDLTQLITGISRDDVGNFIELYLKKHIFVNDPFSSLDIDGVGKLISKTIKRAKKVNPKLQISFCGEQAADPESLEFILDHPVDSVSCSPSSVPLVTFATAKHK